MWSPTNLLHTFIHAGTEQIKEDDLRVGITTGVNLLSVWVCVVTIAVGPIFYIASGRTAVLYGSLGEAVLVTGPIILNFFGKRILANIGLYLILNAAMFYFGVLLGPLVEVQSMIVFLVGLALYIFESSKVRVCCIGASALLLALMEINFKFRLCHGWDSMGSLCGCHIPGFDPLLPVRQELRPTSGKTKSANAIH
jgi:hypothetical protein